MDPGTPKALVVGGAILIFLFPPGCAGISTVEPGARYAYFTAPASDDAWSPKIEGWQRRERAENPKLAAETPDVESDLMGTASGPEARSAPGFDGPPVGLLRSKYFHFRADRKRQLAREFAEWIQSQSRHHYFADGPVDHWATLAETLERDGDDCDGLELLTYRGLRDLGFRKDEVFRSIVYRPSDGQHHMVTLWFEDPDDPWVIDPTGAMTTGLPRMSELPEWVPLKVFGESSEYTVRRNRAQPANRFVAN